MSVPPQGPLPWMRAPQSAPTDDDPEWCEKCDRPLRTDDSCPYCGDET